MRISVFDDLPYQPFTNVANSAEPKRNLLLINIDNWLKVDTRAIDVWS
jgi:hypothetical protein